MLCNSRLNSAPPHFSKPFERGTDGWVGRIQSRHDLTPVNVSPPPFIVCGNGGYHNLHSIHSKPGDKAPDTGAILIYGQDKKWGFLSLTIDDKTISGVSTEVDKNGAASKGDTFDYPTAAVILDDPKSVPTL